MRSDAGLEIEDVAAQSPAAAAGLKAGDGIVSINGYPVRDVIDFMFCMDEYELRIDLLRNGKRKSVLLLQSEEEDSGIAVKPPKVKLCRNNCIFCFVKQLPKGLRKSLYLKDEDYRLSFLYGNYITLSNLDDRDRSRIIEQRLSPLYISVHSTNRNLRDKLLGAQKSVDIMKELRFFADNKIRFHTQIVMCPGYNDGKELKNTIRDLCRFYPYLSSVAVVPVGLTSHRRSHLEPVSRESAAEAIRTAEAFRKRFLKKHGDPLVFCSDEMYIRAGLPFPPLKEYGVLPQIENGVGMVPLFMSQARRVSVPPDLPRDKKIVAVTGASFYPYLKKFTDRLRDKENIFIEARKVENDFFGRSVTVTGLLTGRDVIKSLHDDASSFDVLLLPDTALKEDEDLFLDDVSVSDVQEALGIRTLRMEATPQGLMDAVSSLNAACPQTLTSRDLQACRIPDSC